MPIVRYQNHEGQSFVLHGDGVSFMNLNSLRSYKWNFATSNRPNGMGGKASNFARNPVERSIRVTTISGSLTALNELENRLHSITEPDIISEEPGRLYVGDQYVSCYIVGAEVEEYIKVNGLAIIDFDLLIVEPFWCTETTTVFNIDTSSQTDTTAKKFNLRFPYRFLTGYSNTKLNNLHYAECPMIITIYGPTQNPSIVIAGNIYNVAVQVATGSRLVIDQTRHSIDIVNSVGERTSVFNARNKQYDIFKPLPSGENKVQHGGTFKFSVAIVKQRSGLEWTA